MTQIIIEKVGTDYRSIRYAKQALHVLCYDNNSSYNEEEFDASKHSLYVAHYTTDNLKHKQPIGIIGCCKKTIAEGIDLPYHCSINRDVIYDINIFHCSDTILELGTGVLSDEYVHKISKITVIELLKSICASRNEEYMTITPKCKYLKSGGKGILESFGFERINDTNVYLKSPNVNENIDTCFTELDLTNIDNTRRPELKIINLNDMEDI